jgi:hypothetical protein
MPTHEAPGDVQTVDELIALLYLEPEYRLVLAEGRHDALLINWFLTENDVVVSVNAVSDRLVVTREEVGEEHIDYGEREKLLTVGEKVAVHPDIRNQLTVVVDSDWRDAVGPEIVNRECVIYTDFPALEHYAMEPAPFERFMALGIQAVPEIVADVWADILPALLDVAAVRLTLRGSGIALVPKYPELCQFGEAGGADVRELLRRSMARHPPSTWPGSLDELCRIADGYLQLLRAAEHLGRGHDLAPLLIRRFGWVNHLAIPETVERLMRGALRAEELGSFSMFQRLLERTAAAA